MTIDDAKSLQRGVGVDPDGVIGRGTLSAVFRKMGAPQAIADQLAFAGNVWMARVGILDTRLRLAHFLAQLAHESDNFKAMEEYASGAAYEGRIDLGNTQPGDGKRYKGRGPIQITGRANYRYFGRLLGINIEDKPQLASDPEIGFSLACLYWQDRTLNALADADDVTAITKKINGGTNGLTDRKAKLTVAKGLFK